MVVLNMFNSLVTTAAVLAHAWSGVQCVPLCLAGDFDSQVRHILHKQMLSAQAPADIISRVLDDVRTTLNKRWRGYEAIPFGSLTTGLVSPFSDVDFYIKIPNFNMSAGLYVLQESLKLFKKQPKLYAHFKYFNLVNYTSLQFLHIPSHRKVDLLFEFGEMGVANSKLMKYYFNLDERNLLLGQFLKYWFQIQKRNGHRQPRDYVLYLFIIFYLQQKKMAPPVYMLQKHSKSHFVHDWDVGFNELPYRSTNTENLHQLLGGFFKYYSEFNYEEYIIAPFTGRPIRKSAFLNIENFPKEYSLHSKKLKNIIKNEFDVSTATCVQDPFIHSSNQMERLAHHKETEAFKHFMKSVAAMFEGLPSDSVLRAILVMDQHKETVINDNATVDKSSRLHRCIASR